MGNNTSKIGTDIDTYPSVITQHTYPFRPPGQDHPFGKKPRRFAGSKISPTEVVKQQLAEITQRFQNGSLSSQCRITDRCMLMPTPMMRRKPVTSPMNYPAVSHPFSPKTADVGRFGSEARMESAYDLRMDSDDERDDIMSVVQLYKERRTHNMSLIKCYVESKIDAQVQKHAHARKMMQASHGRRNRMKANTENNALTYPFPE